MGRDDRAGTGGLSDHMSLPEAFFNCSMRSGEIHRLDRCARCTASQLTLLHYRGGPHGWAGCLDGVSVDVSELRVHHP
jgi:hypothetical protein